MERFFLSVIFPALLLVSCSDHCFRDAVFSIEQITDHVYYMEFKGDDGLDEFIAGGGVKNTDQLVEFEKRLFSREFGEGIDLSFVPYACGCSELCIDNPQGDRLMGRNFDWYKCDVLVVRAEPVNGYRSLSTCSLGFMNIPYGTTLHEHNDRISALGCIYAPLDGVNEKGLSIALNVAGDYEVTSQNTDKPDLTFFTAIRLILDRAADVDEAIGILRGYDMHSEKVKDDEDYAFHLIIADAQGKTVCVEWIDNRMSVTNTTVMTNHYLCEPKFGVTLYSDGPGNSFERFNVLSSVESLGCGSVSNEALVEAMSSASQVCSPLFGGTQWTAIYNMTAQSATWYWFRNYSEPFELSLSSFCEGTLSDDIPGAATRPGLFSKLSLKRLFP